MKSIKEVLLEGYDYDQDGKGGIDSIYGEEVEVPKGAQVVSISMDYPKGWMDECYFYKLDHLIRGMEGSGKEDEMKKALSKVGGTYENVDGKTKNLLIRFR